MSEDIRVLIVDDGELQDVCAILDALDVPYAHVPGSTVEQGVPSPSSMLVTTPRHASALAKQFASQGGRGPTGIVIAENDSPVLRTQLRQSGYDFLVRRPVDPTALRLLVMRALYHGPERRAAPRLPSGLRTAFRLGIKTEECILADISTGGCRLFAARHVELGSSVVVRVTGELTGGEAFDARGRVVRCARGEALDAGDAGFTLGVQFEGLAAHDKALLRNMVTLGLLGSHLPEDRRQHERRTYREKLQGDDGEANQVLLGRDISMGGMRVEWHPDLALGQTLRVAVYLGSERAALDIRAVVSRDDGADGMALRFEGMDPEDEAALEEFVAGLPVMEYLPGGEAAGLGAVLSQIVEVEEPSA